MKKALVRFEDIGPGGLYESEESLRKLRAIAEFMATERVPFHVAMIPHFVNPQTGYDKSIADRNDPYVKLFHSTIEHLRACGASIGLHGDRHQYGQAVTADGFEFAYKACTADCPPDDPVEAYVEREAFAKSYVSQRMREGFATVRQSGLRVDWFETPHYTASDNQRWLLESWVGLFFENDPRADNDRRVSVRDVDTPLFRGVVYVPTPLYYVDGAQPDAEVERMTEEIKSFSDGEVAAFFYHPFLEFPFIHLEQVDGKTRVRYDENSYLKRLVRTFKRQQFTFVPLLSLVPFVPSVRQTDFFPGVDFELLTGDLNGDGRSELVVWERSTGDVHAVLVDLNGYPSRQREDGPFPVVKWLSNWVRGEGWTLLVGDFNGDGHADLAAWHAQRGAWRFAWSDGKQLHDDAKADWQGFAVGKQWVPFVGDFNGDGCAEVAVWNLISGEWRVREGVSMRVWMNTGHIGRECVARVGDFNGDGRTDVVLWNPRLGTWQVALSNGKRFVLDADTRDTMWLSGWAVGSQWEPLVGDFDGDGRDDLLVVDAASGTWRVARSAGMQFVPTGELQPWAAGAEMQPLVGVFDETGRTSLCARQAWLRGGVVDFAVSVFGCGKKGG